MRKNSWIGYMQITPFGGPAGYKFIDWDGGQARTGYIYVYPDLKHAKKELWKGEKIVKVKVCVVGGESDGKNHAED
jgi:hypothetical protein